MARSRRYETDSFEKLPDKSRRRHRQTISQSLRSLDAFEDAQELEDWLDELDDAWLSTEEPIRKRRGTAI